MYAATAFIILEAGDIILPRFGLPEWTVKLLIILLIIGFPITVIISWIFDITPDGIIKTERVDANKKNRGTHQPRRRIISINNLVITILFIVVCILLYPRILNKAKIADITDLDKKTIELIAVLPFYNTKSDPQTDYLGFALADQIIGNLIYLNNITVRPSGSVRKYEKQVIDPIITGNDLKVDYILIGNYLKESNTIRLNIELVEVNTNEMIWREPIEVDFNSAFELQDIVAQKVVEGLNVQFSQKELTRAGKDIPDNPLAYEYYLRSISYPFTNDGDQLAIEMLNKSIELDSNYAPAYAQLGDRLHRLAQFGLLNPEETKRSENFYLKALSLNEDYIYALSNLAQIYTETARIEQAVQLTQKILKINPNNAEAHFSLGYIYRYAGMNNEAIQEMEKAITIDPKNPGFRSIVITYQLAGEYEKSFEASKIFNQSSFILGEQGAALFRQGDLKQAIDYFDRSIDMDPDGLLALWITGMKAYIEGNIEAGLDAARKFENANIIDAEAWYHFAGNYGLLGDRDGCIRTLQRAVDGGFFNYPFMLSDSFLDSVRNDPEFQKILQKAKEKHLAFRKRFF
jgi:TolB-like protein